MSRVPKPTSIDARGGIDGFAMQQRVLEALPACRSQPPGKPAQRFWLAAHLVKNMAAKTLSPNMAGSR